jgi:alpha-tubulin suppressor-like RCC1 family protein
MEVGDTERFVAEVHEQGGPNPGPILPNVELTWSSSDPNVVSIDAGSGVAVAQEAGTSQIEVCAPRSCSAWDIIVIARIAGVAVVPDSITLLPHDQFDLTAILTDVHGEPVWGAVHDPLFWDLFASEMMWSTADPNVAVVNLPSGPPSLLEGVAHGTTHVTARFREFSGSAKVVVVVVDLTYISTGGAHTCALTDTGEPYCWGRSGFEHFPEFVPHGTEVPVHLVSLSSGAEQTCGLTASGTAYCWGSSFWAALGRAELLQPLGTPVPVDGGGQYATITAGGAHTCAIGVGGELHCWGANTFGQLGITSTETCGGGVGKIPVGPHPCERVPAAVSDRPTFTALSAGASHTCGLVADGTAFCWGQIGSRESSDTLRVPGGHLFASIASGSGMACGLTASGDAYCWGGNDDGLGDGSTVSSDEPVLVAGDHVFAQLSIGRAACGVTTAGELYCWGWHEPLIAGATPTRVGDNIVWASVHAGGVHGCGMSVDGVAYCWGSNHTGAVGVPGEWIGEPTRVVGQIEP